MRQQFLEGETPLCGMTVVHQLVDGRVGPAGGARTPVLLASAGMASNRRVR